MLTIAYYFLQVVICSAVMMAYYALVLRNERFHQYNRFYLLGVALLPWVVPVIKIQWDAYHTIAQPKMIQFLSVVADNNSYLDATIARKGFQLDWDAIIIGAYVMVSVFFFVSLIIALWRIYSLLKAHSCRNLGSVWIIFTKAKGTPFSFFKYIFWNEEINLQSSEGKQMLQHELTHVKEKHSIDKLIMQVVMIAGWFNPFFWLARREMGLIHEFIADKKAVGEGDASSLATMLLAAAYPQQRFVLTHPFFFSPIKRRLLMLTKIKNPRFSYMRRLIVLPMLALIVILFAFRTKDHSPVTPVSLDKTYTIVVDAGHGGKDMGAKGLDGSHEKDYALSLAKFIKALNTNDKINIVLSRDNDVFMDPAAKAAFAKENHADLFISLHCNNANQVTRNGKAENEISGIEVYIADKKKAVNYDANYAFANNVASSIKAVDNHFLGIKTRPVGIWVLSAVTCPSILIETGFLSNPSDLKKMKDESYQKKMANAVLEGVNNYLSGNAATPTGWVIINNNDTVKPKKNESLPKVTIVSYFDSTFKNRDKWANGKYPLIVIDGVIKKDASILNTLDMEQVDTVSVMKGDMAVAKYGEAARDGVIKITTKTSRFPDTLAWKRTNGASVAVVKFDEAPKSPDTPAEFPGGVTAWVKYLERNLDSDVPKGHGAPVGKYEVTVVFMVDHTGAVSKFRIEGNPGYGIGTEAMRVIKNGPSWKPAMKNGQNVDYEARQEITFIVMKDDEAKTPAVTSSQINPAQPAEDYDKVFTVVQIPAEFPGGLSAWTQYLKRNLNSDIPVKNNAPSGKYTVIVSFIVDKNGSVSNVKTENDPGYGTAEEAMRMIKKGPIWKPAVQNGRNVIYRARQQVTFNVAPKEAP